MGRRHGISWSPQSLMLLQRVPTHSGERSWWDQAFKACHSFPKRKSLIWKLEANLMTTHRGEGSRWDWAFKACQLSVMLQRKSLILKLQVNFYNMCLLIDHYGSWNCIRPSTLILFLSTKWVNHFHFDSYILPRQPGQVQPLWVGAVVIILNLVLTFENKKI